MNRIEEISKRLGNNALLMNKRKFDSLKKITKTTKVSDYEVETPYGWVNIEALHETIPYQVYELKLDNGYDLKCADNHIIINDSNKEVFVKDLKNGDVVKTDNGNSKVISVTDLGYEEVMYDLELSKDSDRVFYTNGILSHNTYLTKLLAKEVFGNEDSLLRVDMSEYMEKHSVSKLIGPPPGYVGYEQGGQLTEVIRKKPYSLILFDEIEKAHPDVFNILLQLLDDGHLTDSMGRKVNFKNCLIILTSNVGAKDLDDFSNSVGFKTNTVIGNELERTNSIINKALKNKFKPEFLNRLDDVIVFNNLTLENIIKICEIEINKLKYRLKEIGYTLKISKSSIEFIAKVGYDPSMGARPINRAIQRYIEDEITDEILNGNIPEGGIINITLNKNKDKLLIKGK